MYLIQNIVSIALHKNEIDMEVKVIREFENTKIHDDDNGVAVLDVKLTLDSVIYTLCINSIFITHVEDYDEVIVLDEPRIEWFEHEASVYDANDFELSKDAVSHFLSHVDVEELIKTYCII